MKDRSRKHVKYEQKRWPMPQECINHKHGCRNKAVMEVVCGRIRVRCCTDMGCIARAELIAREASLDPDETPGSS